MRNIESLPARRQFKPNAYQASSVCPRDVTVKPLQQAYLEIPEDAIQSGARLAQEQSVAIQKAEYVESTSEKTYM